MPKGIPEYNFSDFNALAPGDVSLRVPIFNASVQIYLDRESDTYEMKGLLVHIDGGSEAPPDLISISREDGESLQMRRNNGHPGLRNPVDNVSFSKSDTGVWVPDRELEIDNRFTFIRFANLTVAFAKSRQLRNHGEQIVSVTASPPPSV
ncbi:MAG TPA: hypothetical protein VLF88_03895 [Candidatus Babeliales bacterium]|nr:hypothetical protein [Candidatus Babeliales bacterium]